MDNLGEKSSIHMLEIRSVIMVNYDNYLNVKYKIFETIKILYKNVALTKIYSYLDLVKVDWQV